MAKRCWQSVMLKTVSGRAARFLKECARVFAGELVAVAVSGDGTPSMAGRAIGQAAVNQMFAFFSREPRDEQLKTFDEVAALTPEDVAAIVREELRENGELRRCFGRDEAGRAGLVEAVERTVELVPHHVRRRITRPGDGGLPTTLPGQLPKNSAEMAGFLPARVPRLERGAELPGRLVMERLVGTGGFGEVWLATSRALGVELDRAVKFCLDPELTVSLRNDVKMMAEVLQAGGHPNVVTIYETTNLEHDPPFLVMEYAPGGDLLNWVAQFEGAAVPVERAMEVLRQVAEGLAFAHGLTTDDGRRLVHRDLKPANILVGRDGRFMIADFGIAVLAGPEGGLAPITGQTILTSAQSAIYSDPMRAFGTPSPADDIYALGVIGVQLLLSDPRDRSGEPVVSRFSVPLPQRWLRDLRAAGVPADLAELLADAMDRPEHRPQDGAAFLARLRALGVAGGGAPAPRAEARPVKPVAGDPLARWEPLSVFRDRLKDGSEGPEMVVIPAGKFVMGAPKGEEGSDESERPQHEVTFAEPFALGENAVTFDLYDRLCEATGAEKPADEGWGRGGRPVINVSWHKAKAYCAWLSAQTGYEYRLPSEAEWEYACRAGTDTRFCFGEMISTGHSNYNSNFPYGRGQEGTYRQRTVPVSEIADAVNAWGLRHMHGNAFEWCEDWWHGSYVHAPRDGRPWLDANDGDSTDRVMRGGSWINGPSGIRSAFRGKLSGGYFNRVIGFRLARSLLTH